jgi:cytochrome c oxidase assembly protein subunit 20
MADDTRQSDGAPAEEQAQSEPRRPRRPKPKHDFPQTQAGKIWEALGNPEEPINTIPGGTYNSAGGKPAEVSWRDAFNFSYEGKGPSWYQTPCARDSLLVGIASGGAVGGLRFVLKGTPFHHE